MRLSFKSVSGRAIAPWMETLAELRMEVFREWPYLYDGNLEYEEAYLKHYLASDESVVILVFDGAYVIGASTAIPMEQASPDLQEPFLRQGYPIKEVFYFGESVVRRSYRGNGFGSTFFQMREVHARSVMPEVQFTTFCAVQRPDDHPRRPEDARSLVDFWKRQGYQPVHGLSVAFPWKDLDEERETHKELQFWLKAQSAGQA